MKRRHVIKGVAAGAVSAVGVGSATDGSATRVDVEQFDYLSVVEDGDTIARVPDPTWGDVREVETDLSDGQRLVTPAEDCVAFCEANCPCKPCLVGCFDCCNPEESICDDC